MPLIHSDKVEGNWKARPQVELIAVLLQVSKYSSQDYCYLGVRGSEKKRVVRDRVKEAT